ncbi:MAG: alpha/beta hydrolase [Patescibacteria group bacterium]
MVKKVEPFTVKINGAEISCIQEGGGPADVVFFHGLYDRKNTWEKYFFPLLPRTGYRFTAFDYPGSGESRARGKSSYDIKWLAEIAEALFSCLGIKKLNAYGMSLGALVASALASRNQDLVEAMALQGLFVSSEALARSFPFWVKARNEFLGHPKRSHAWLLAFCAWRRLAVKKEASSLLHVFGHLMNAHEEEFMGRQFDFIELAYENVKHTAPRAAAGEIFTLLSGVDPAFYSRIHAPTLLIDGENPFPRAPFNMVEIARRFPAETFLKTLTVPRAGHYATLLEPAICLYSALAFFAEVEARRRK